MQRVLFTVEKGNIKGKFQWYCHFVAPTIMIIESLGWTVKDWRIIS